MSRMLPEIDTLEQHQDQVQNNPDLYRPDSCPHCGKAGLHHHGHYVRQSPTGEGMAYLSDLLIILRFFCSSCRRTCSRLPGCLSPWRHYWWTRQQEALTALLDGKSIYQVEREQPPSRHTIGRWWRWLEEGFDQHALHLRSRFADLGRAVDWPAFWRLCFGFMPLSEAMGWLDRMEVNVP